LAERFLPQPDEQTADDRHRPTGHRGRRCGRLSAGGPWLVAVEDEHIAAYTRQGPGLRVMRELIDGCTSAGMREMPAVIGDSGNEGSIKLHEKCGFTFCGRFDAVGLTC